MCREDLQADIEGICRHNNDAFAQIAQQLRPWGHTMTQSWRGLTGVDPEDLAQAAWLGLVEAADTYRAERGDFLIWARGVMRRRILDAVKAISREKHQMLNRAIVRDPDPMSRARGSDPCDQWIDQREWYERVIALFQELSPLECTVLRYRLHDFTPTEIANTIHISDKAVDNAWQRVRRKAHNLLVRHGAVGGPQILFEEA